MHSCMQDWSFLLYVTSHLIIFCSIPLNKDLNGFRQFEDVILPKIFTDLIVSRSGGDESFELLHPVVNFAESGNFDKGGDAGQFGNGNLLSFFSQIYDGPFFHSDDMMIL
ncbi:uncharacterized protein [Parasteatoda tepidariorum]|uniref:uncharacterized protein isoform X1 n=1 Tax=Parasteatoda tepidariorum TaxID=114398 RepID=UPI0039BCD910